MYLENELNGILVVSIEQAVAAPYCSLLLRNSGARVIKVERKEGDFARNYDKGLNGKSAIFSWLNRGKESIVLDFDREEDKKLLSNIINKADILLSNLSNESLEKRNITRDHFRKNNPGLIHCKISGFNSKSKFSNKKAYDFLIQAETGLCSVSGIKNKSGKVGISISDLSTGLTAFSAILRALILRNKKKQGLDIEISMFDVMADWMNMPLLIYRNNKKLPKSDGLSHSFISPYGAYKTKDKKYILISIQNEREWKNFCEKVLGSPEMTKHKLFNSNVERFKNRKSLNNIINSKFSKYKKNKLLKKLDKAKIANANLNNVKDLSEHALIKNKKVIFDNDEALIAALPLENENFKNIHVPNLNQNFKPIYNEFNERDTK